MHLDLLASTLELAGSPIRQPGAGQDRLQRRMNKAKPSMNRWRCGPYQAQYSDELEGVLHRSVPVAAVGLYDDEDHLCMYCRASARCFKQFDAASKQTPTKCTLQR